MVRKILSVFAFALLIQGCVTTPKMPEQPEISQMEIRQLQAYHTNEMSTVLRAVIFPLNVAIRNGILIQ